MQKGTRRIEFYKPVYVTGRACIAGQKEGEGPLGGLIDRIVEDPYFGGKTWEEGESILQRQTLQLLLEKSYEYGEHRGLGLIKGEIRPIADVIDPTLKIPHIGWNALHFGAKKDPLFRYVEEGECVYFVHSFYGANCAPAVIATTEYGAELTAAVAAGNVCGCQFHPEKSGQTGLKILKAFCEGREGAAC